MNILRKEKKENKKNEDKFLKILFNIKNSIIAL